MKRTALKSDPANVAAFVARARAKGLKRTNRAPTSRSTPKRSTGLRVRRPKRRLTTPPDVRAAVLARDNGLCVWCRKPVRGVWHPHHTLARQEWPEFNDERRAIVTLHPQCHMQHEHSPGDRLPWAKLPYEVREFLRDVCANDARAARFVQTKYPGAVL